MNNVKSIYTAFTFDWTVKSTSYQIRYRKAFSLNEIDDALCSIININGNEITVSKLALLLGFNLQDLAEKDILNVYLGRLSEYDLILLKEEKIQLTFLGEEALKTKLKYKYYFANTELFENQNVSGTNFDFSFKDVFEFENELFHRTKSNTEKLPIDDPELKQKLQFQLFVDDIFKGEIIDVLEGNASIHYRTILLHCEILAVNPKLIHFALHEGGPYKPEIQWLIELADNAELKKELLKKGMYQYLLSTKDSITKSDIEDYIEFWNWKDLVANAKLDWNDKEIFKLFIANGDGSLWNVISEKAPVNVIKTLIQEFVDYWDWSILTKRLDDGFIVEQIETFGWDFEEISYKEPNLVMTLLSNAHLTARGWDWNYLSTNLPDDFIENHLEDYNWDWYAITNSKKEVFKNAFIKYRAKLDILISKNWNWQLISEEINIKFLYKNLSILSKYLDWQTILNRFFNNAEISAKCLKDEAFEKLFKHHLAANYFVAHQDYIWTLSLIDFFEKHNLIQWRSEKYIKGFDTNENVEWNRNLFEKYHNKIDTAQGYLNVSRHITEYRIIEDFPEFSWDWEGISQNQMLISNPKFINDAFIGLLPFSSKLIWHDILSRSPLDVSFWSNNLEAFYKTSNSEDQLLFWKKLTPKVDHEFVFANKHFPWDWSFITDSSSEETILESFEDEQLFEKWDWKIATRKIDKEIIFENLEEFARVIDWKYLINEVFTFQNELSEEQLPRVATCLSILNIDYRLEIWKDLTQKIPFENLFQFVESTIQIDVFEWDWDYISNHNYFPTDVRSLNRFKQKINWSILTESRTIQQKFNPDSWENGKEWFGNVDLYLQRFQNYWDWQLLSRNRNINYNRLLLQKYRANKWDWDYLSEFGGFLTEQKRDRSRRDYLEDVLKQFPEVKFQLLSKRKDILLHEHLILKYRNKDWDWQALSENENAWLSNEIIIELSEKDWNWKAISKRIKAELNEPILQLKHKDWDWKYFSEDEHIDFNIEFVKATIAKDWNWRVVSRHKSFLPTIEILTLTKEFDLDWKYISTHSLLIPTKELLAKFEDKLHWPSITEHPQLNFEEIDFIDRFASKWNWHFICESGKLKLNSQVLSRFKDHLDWNLISSNTNLNFTKEIVQEFKGFWNWSNLKENKRASELLGTYVKDVINESPTLNFISKIQQQYSPWKGYIYHFAHIDNAVEIIKLRKIQSRNKAKIKSDAAGNVVHLRDDAHDYARFYFRPHTPTQFYNEFLGKNITDGYRNKYDGWVSWYEKARGLGFPKCPIPIFFKFSLKEVLFKNEPKCCISNGNMQTSSTQFGNIDKMIHRFAFDDLYYTPKQYATKEDYKRYRNYAQQEFLVKDELCFNELSDFEIICPSENDRALLIHLLGNDQKDIHSSIVVDSRYYNNENPRVKVEEEDSELHIKSDFNGQGYFTLQATSNIKDLQILAGDVNKISNDKIVFSSYISVGNINQKVQLTFIDESNRNWFVYTK